MTPIIVPKLRHVYIDPAVAASVPGVSLWRLMGLAGVLAMLLLLRLRKKDYPSAATPPASAHAPGPCSFTDILTGAGLWLC